MHGGGLRWVLDDAIHHQLDAVRLEIGIGRQALADGFDFIEEDVPPHQALRVQVLVLEWDSRTG